MRLIFPKTSKRTSLWQGQTHWELMYFFWLWRETEKRDLCEGHRNINYKSRLMPSKYHTEKWLLFSSSQSKAKLLEFWTDTSVCQTHLCHGGQTHKQESLLPPKWELFGVGIVCFCQSRAQAILVGWNKSRGRSQLLEFHDYSQAPEFRTVNVFSSDKNGTKYTNNIRIWFSLYP